MLYWICPECGHECSPAIRECPTCTAPPLVLFAAAVNLSPAPPEVLKWTPSSFLIRTAAPTLASAPPLPKATFSIGLADAAPIGDLKFNAAPIAGRTILEPLKHEPARPVLVSSRLKPAGESLAELAIGSIQSSFQEMPALCLLPPPEEVVMPPAPPVGRWMRPPKLKLTPIAPENSGRAALTAGPQAPTLAGPSLPQLRDFVENRNSSHSNRQRSGVPGWLVSFLIATVLLLGGGSLLRYLASDRNASASLAAATPRAQITNAGLPMRVVEEHPAARSVEVAGVRVVTGLNKRPQLQYVVINHSATELTGLNIRISVRSVDGLAGTPLLSISSVVPFLGPSQAKEIRADLDPSLKPAAIPDWQSLRTEVLIARQ